MELRKLLKEAKETKDRKGMSLLERARASLLSGSFHRYNATTNSCDCPYRRRTGRTCKHMVAAVILSFREKLERHPKWREFFRELDRRREEVLEAFSDF